MAWIDKANLTFNSDGTIAGTRVIVHGMRDEGYVEIPVDPVQRIEWSIDASDGTGPVSSMKIALAPGAATIPVELAEIVQRPGKVFVVRFMNYEPPEIDSLWFDKDAAEKRAEEANRENKTDGWLVEWMSVS